MTPTTRDRLLTYAALLVYAALLMIAWAVTP